MDILTICWDRFPHFLGFSCAEVIHEVEVNMLQTFISRTQNTRFPHINHPLGVRRGSHGKSCKIYLICREVCDDSLLGLIMPRTPPYRLNSPSKTSDPARDTIRKGNIVTNTARMQTHVTCPTPYMNGCLPADVQLAATKRLEDLPYRYDALAYAVEELLGVNGGKVVPGYPNPLYDSLNTLCRNPDHSN